MPLPNVLEANTAASRDQSAVLRPSQSPHRGCTSIRATRSFVCRAWPPHTWDGSGPRQYRGDRHGSRVLERVIASEPASVDAMPGTRMNGGVVAVVCRD